MGTVPQESVTRLLDGVTDGDAAAADQLLPLVYGELRSLAAVFFRDQRPSHTLQPTALVHEAYLKLVGQTEIRFSSRNQFFVLAARAMRSILVDHARTKNRAKRGGGLKRLSIDVAEPAGRERNVVDMLALDEALGELAGLDDGQARLVELRFFAGLTAEHAAEVLGISRSTAAQEWRLARAWLKRRLKGDEA